MGFFGLKMTDFGQTLKILDQISSAYLVMDFNGFSGKCLVVLKI